LILVKYNIDFKNIYCKIKLIIKISNGRVKMSDSLQSGDKVKPRFVPVLAIGGVPANQKIEKMDTLTVSGCNWNAGLKLTLKGVHGVYNPDDFEKVS
jgi:hypothetical protein